MITTLHSLTTTRALFSTNELPWEIHQPVLMTLVNPRVISWSMNPTLQPGDRLELEPAPALHIGDVIVFRQETLFVCHRIERIEHQRLYTRGDAGAGPAEAIDVSAVVGRVTALERDGQRLSISAPATLRHGRLKQRTGNHAGARRDSIRSVAHGCVTWLLSVPLVSGVLCRLATRLITVDLMEDAPVRAFSSYIKRGSLRLSCIAECGTHLAHINAARAALVIRIGPLVLGSGRLSPWTLHLRPIASPLDIESSMQTLRSLVEHRRGTSNLISF